MSALRRVPLFVFVFSTTVRAILAPALAETRCAPTRSDSQGPFYQPGAPKIFAPGHATLTTQLYPEARQTEITFDIVVEK